MEFQHVACELAHKRGRNYKKGLSRYRRKVRDEDDARKLTERFASHRNDAIGVGHARSGGSKVAIGDSVEFEKLESNGSNCTQTQRGVSKGVKRTGSMGGAPLLIRRGVARKKGGVIHRFWADNTPPLKLVRFIGHSKGQMLGGEMLNALQVRFICWRGRVGKGWGRENGSSRGYFQGGILSVSRTVPRAVLWRAGFFRRGVEEHFMARASRFLRVSEKRLGKMCG